MLRRSQIGLSPIRVSKMMRSLVNNSMLQQGVMKRLGVGFKRMVDVFGFKVENDRVQV